MGLASMGATALDALQAYERDVLAVLALAAEHFSGTSARERVLRARLRGPTGKALVAGEIDGLLRRLVDQGLVVSDAGVLFVSPLLVAPALDDAHARGVLPALVPAYSFRSHGWGSSEPMLTDPVIAIRYALATGQPEAVSSAARPRYGQEVPLVPALGTHPTAAWIRQLPAADRTRYLDAILLEATLRAVHLGDAVVATAAEDDTASVRAAAQAYAILRGAGRTAAAEAGDGWYAAAARALADLVDGAWEDALAGFRAAGALRSKRAPLAGGVFGVFHVLLECLRARTPEEVGALPALAARVRPVLQGFPSTRWLLSALATLRATGSLHGIAPAPAQTRVPCWIDPLVAELLAELGEKRVRDGGATLRGWARRAREQGFPWIAEQLAEQPGPRALRGLVPKDPAWARALDALSVLAPPAGRPTAAASIVWVLTLGEWSTRVQARLVPRPGAKGSSLPLSRVAESPAASEADLRIADHLREVGRDGLEPHDLLPLVGHPRVVDEAGEPLSVELREPHLRLEAVPGGTRLRMIPEAFEGLVTAWREGGRVVLVRQSPAAARVQAIVGGGIVVPETGRERLASALQALGDVLPVETDAKLQLEETTADARPHVQLFRAGEGLRARLRVRPGGPAGRSFRPGQPPAELVAHEGGQLRRVRRDVEAEHAGVAALVDACPVLASLEADGEDLVARDLETCLELLLELEAVRDVCVIEWPAGAALAAPKAREARHLRMRVQSKGDWLAVDGEIDIDEGQVLAMRELLAGVSKARGRFVPIGDDRWVVLTAELRRKLGTVAAAEALGGDKERVPASLVLALDAATEGLDVSWDKAVAKTIDRLRGALTDEVTVPPSLDAELRDYQVEGFRFLARRAGAGVGAILADDMGLGKTVQALALLAHRAKDGPALVIAPTSVTRNWEDETRRFAPKLRVRRLGEGDRGATLAAARAHDVVIASYGMLVAEAEAIATKPFATVVFDEAQALKNPATRRAAAARRVQASARVALTGTPVENHVGELHAILDCVSPGALGPRATFERAFGSRTEGEGRAGLRALVRPFVLRRSKRQVLSELPEKTELVRTLEPSAEHRAFYEALRRRTLEHVAAAQVGRGGKGKLEVLAALTRLRRAAIDPRLVGGEDAPEGPKIEALVELVRELKDEGHRALVFSQFLEPLDFAGRALGDAGLTTVRLDGTMNAATRAAAVQAFGDGRADAFLLSLKAGGLGMNLTAADYVIHLDPWWNPAVEDQATDRAHRIGQTRPVTVVRLVTEGTIEDKVLRLHAAKRALYEDVVGDADGGGALDLASIVELLGGA